MAQISIAPDLFQRLQEYAQQMQRPVDDIIQEILATAMAALPLSAPSSPSVDELLQALDRISGSLEIPDAEERIRHHDRYFAGLEDEDVP
jgi:hypothetical protein